MFRYIMMFCAGIVGLSFALTSGMPRIAEMAERNSKQPGQTEQAAAMEAPQPTQRVGARQVAINANEQGHYESNFRINGSNVSAMIDTGATLVAINESTARRAGVHLSAADYTDSVQTANGKAKAAAVMLETVQIGAITVHDVQAVVMDDEALAHTLVGMSFLNRLKGYEAKNQRLLLTQ